MKIICTIENLKSAVATAERFTGRHITLPILSYLLIKSDDKKTTITATNLETGIEYTFPSKTQKTGIITAPAKPLNQLLQSIDGEQITIESKQNHLIIRTAASDTTLLSLNPDDFPSLPIIKKDYTFTITSDIFISSLQQVIPSVSSSDIKPEISGVFLNISPEKIIIAATDSFRLAEKTIEKCDGIKNSTECIVPARTIQELIRTIQSSNTDDVCVSLGERQIVFEWNDVRIISRLIDGAYPPYRNIIPKAYETTLFINRDDFLKKIRLASIFSSRLNDVTLKFSTTELEISTSNADMGNTTSRLNIKGRGASGSVVFNYRYLLDGLAAFNEENVVLNLNGVSGPALLQNQNDQTILYLLMPIRSV